jgi:hypothetical protein
MGVDWFCARPVLEPYHLLSWSEARNLSFADALSLNALCDVIDVRIKVGKEENRGGK